MCVGHDDSAVEQREARGTETDGQGIAVGAVAVDIEGAGAVAFEGVAAVDDGDGNLDAILCFDPDTLGGVAGGVEAAGNLLLLEQRGFAGGDVVVVDGGGGDQRLVAVAEGVGDELAVDVGLRGVGGLGEADFFCLA